MLTQVLANSDSFRRQIIEQASPPRQKLLQALHYGAAQTFASLAAALARRCRTALAGNFAEASALWCR
jgi:hypothetical protein